jgi:hypothetical protein
VAMSRSYTDRQVVEEVIDEILAGYYPFIKRELQIEELNFDVTKKDFVTDRQGFRIDEYTRASAVPNWELQKIEEVILFSENISDYVNGKFSIIYDINVFNEVVRIVIKFALIHELVHVKQVDNGLTKEEYERTKYEDNEYEKEANEKAAEILNREGKFQEEIVKMILCKDKKIDNENVIDIVKLFNGNF